MPPIPPRQPVADAIVGIECRAAVPIAAADLTLQALGGSGGTVVQFGGATAATEAVRYANPFATRGGLLPAPPTAPALPGDVVAAPAALVNGALPAISGGPAAVAETGALGNDTGELASRFGTIAGGRGGAALLAGLLGLLVVFLIAAADYTRMRRRVDA